MKSTMRTKKENNITTPTCQTCNHPVEEYGIMYCQNCQISNIRSVCLICNKMKSLQVLCKYNGICGLCYNATRRNIITCKTCLNTYSQCNNCHQYRSPRTSSLQLNEYNEYTGYCLYCSIDT